MTSWIHASNLRIADFAFWTSADGSVAREETFGTCAAVTGIHADSVQAGFVGAAFVVSHTSGRVVNWDGNTTLVGIRHPAISTRTNHGPEWDRVDDRANSRDVTRAELVARVSTSFLQASPSGGTV